MAETQVIKEDEDIDLEYEDGETWVLGVEYKDSDNNIIPLTGYTASFRIKKNPSTDTLLELTEIDGIDIDEAQGELTITLTEDQTTELGVERYVYDLRVRSTVPFTTKLMRGHISGKFAND